MNNFLIKAEFSIRSASKTAVANAIDSLQPTDIEDYETYSSFNLGNLHCSYSRWPNCIEFTVYYNSAKEAAEAANIVATIAKAVSASQTQTEKE